jgi:hypothetical protein
MDSEFPTDQESIGPVTIILNHSIIDAAVMVKNSTILNHCTLN